MLLIAVVMFLPNGILGGLALLAQSQAEGLEAVSESAALSDARRSTKVSARSSSPPTSNFNLPQGVRYALIGPNGAGKTTLINLMTGMLRPDAGRIFLGDEDITALPPEERVRRGLVRTYQINSLFPHLTALESVTLAVCERRRVARTWWRPLTAYREEIDEAHAILVRADAGAGLPPPDARTRLRPAAAARNRAGAGDAAQGAAARRAGRRRAARGEQGFVRSDRRPVARHHRAVHRARHGAGVPFRLAHHRAGRRPRAGRKARRPKSPPTSACARSISARRIGARARMAEMRCSRSATCAPAMAPASCSTA